MNLKHFHLEKTDSTNAEAKRLLDNGDEIVLVSAENQEKGRGRNNKQWFGDPGENALMSFGIKHHDEPAYEEIASFQGKGCLAAIKALRELSGYEGFRLKYPNDVFAIDKGIAKKICGVLVENAYRAGNCIHTVVGIGINNKQSKFPEDILTKATSLSLLGFNIDNKTVIHSVLNEFVSMIYQPPEEIVKLWQNELNIQGREVNVVDKPGRWIAEGILSDGRLELSGIVTNERIFIDNGDSIRYEIK
ncbi:MAG: biotin--[acetyl-CoA-carboxylase] ligase [Bacteroidota bacterium]